MIRPALLLRPAHALPLAAAFVFGTLTAAALAQGTAEQREACTPDALKLCSDMIPDVAKTTACMKAHEAELSPRCHAAFITEPPPAADEPEDRPHKRRVARAPTPDDETPIARPRRYQAPDDDFPDAPPRRYRAPEPDDAADAGDVDHARDVISRLCDDEMIDPRTCAVTERALGGR